MAHEGPTVHFGTELAELDPIVGAFHLDCVINDVRGDFLPLGTGDAGDVGEVHLALSVIGANFREGFAQECQVECTDSRVDFGDRTLLVVRVLMFDDRFDLGAVGAAHDAAVSGRVVEVSGEDRHARFRLLVGLDEGAERF